MVHKTSIRNFRKEAEKYRKPQQRTVQESDQARLRELEVNPPPSYEDSKHDQFFQPMRDDGGGGRGGSQSVAQGMGQGVHGYGLDKSRAQSSEGGEGENLGGSTRNANYQKKGGLSMDYYTGMTLPVQSTDASASASASATASESAQRGQASKDDDRDNSDFAEFRKRQIQKQFAAGPRKESGLYGLG